MNSPFRCVAHITARFIAPATSRPGGRQPASTPSRSPVGSGDEPGSMIRKIVTKRVSRRARTLDQLPRHLTVPGNRGPTRLSQSEWTTVDFREQHGRPPRCRNRCPALSRQRRHRLCRSHHRWPRGNLAGSRQALSGLAAPAILRAHLGCAEPCRAQRGPQCAGSAGPVRWSAAQSLGPPRRAGRPDLPRSGRRVLALHRNRRQRMANRR